MLIQYKVGGVREVSDLIGGLLVHRKIADQLYNTREMKAEPLEAAEEPEAKAKASPRTGKPKRQYKRRDMKAQG